MLETEINGRRACLVGVCSEKRGSGVRRGMFWLALHRGVEYIKGERSRRGKIMLVHAPHARSLRYSSS